MGQTCGLHTAYAKKQMLQAKKQMRSSSSHRPVYCDRHAMSRLLLHTEAKGAKHGLHSVHLACCKHNRSNNGSRRRPGAPDRIADAV